jgi:hypothetical protein
MGRTSPDDTPHEARPRVVAYSARPTQRTLNLQTHRDGVPPRRLKWLRMGSRAERQPCLPGTRFLVRRRPTPTHHMEGTTSCATRHRILFTTTTRMQRLTPRGQHRRRGDAVQIDYSFPCHDDRITKALALTYLNDINIRPRYIRSNANIWADSLSRELDRDDWQLNPQIFGYLQTMWGPHSIDHFATMENTQLPMFNARWRDPKCEDVDSLHLPDTAWQREANYCKPPWAALPALCAKYTSQAQQPPSSHPTGPTNRGFNTYTTWLPRPSTAPPHATYSSPAGTARARGSDDHDGASWLFHCHAGLVAQPQRRNRAHITDFEP